jgi:hypothetical protein
MERTAQRENGGDVAITPGGGGREPPDEPPEAANAPLAPPGAPPAPLSEVLHAGSGANAATSSLKRAPYR